MIFTDLNIEQSFAKHLADKFTTKSYNIYWRDTKNLVGAFDKTLTILRDFPEDPTHLVKPGQADVDHDNLISIPALTVRVETPPKTTDTNRLGIGESHFEWRAEIRMECLASTELEWYDFTAWFQEWLNHPDTRITIRPYRDDLTVEEPEPSSEHIRLTDADLIKREIAGQGFPVAARYLIQFAATALFIE